jgi:hypothetical protein
MKWVLNSWHCNTENAVGRVNEKDKISRCVVFYRALSLPALSSTVLCAPFLYDPEELLVSLAIDHISPTIFFPLR